MSTYAQERLWPNPDFKKAALVVIDCQNDFLHDKGWYSTHDVNTSHMRRILGPLKNLVSECRNTGISVVYTQHGFRDMRDGGILVQKRPILHDGGLRKGTWGWEIHNDVKPTEDDWIIDKSRLSAFYNSNLDVVLRGLAVDILLLTGVLTNQCVESTARDASFRDYRVIILSDCVGTIHVDLHESALRAARVGFADIATSEEIIGEIKASKSSQSPKGAIGMEERS